MTERNRDLSTVLKNAEATTINESRGLPKRIVRMAMIHRALVDNHGEMVRRVAEMYQFGLDWNFIYSKGKPAGYKDLGIINYLGYEYYCSMYHDGFVDDEPKEAPNPGDIVRRW